MDLIQKKTDLTPGLLFTSRRTSGDLYTISFLLKKYASNRLLVLHRKQGTDVTLGVCMLNLIKSEAHVNPNHTLHRIEL